MSQLAAESASPSLLTVNDVEVIYDGAILAVAGVSLHVPKGAIVALLGANGAGKSTTLKAISGLVRAERAEVSRGVIEYAGLDLAGVDPSQRVRKGMVHVLEGRHVFGQLTVEDNLRFPFSLKTSRKRRFDLKTVTTLLGHAGKNPDFLAKRAADLSGGESQVVSLIRTLQLNPEVLLLDEPTAALDPTSSHEVEALIDAWFAGDRSRACI